MRVRTINPELYADEQLGDLELRTPLPVFRTFVGLISYADREGRFRWSARAIRGALAPCWDGDMASTLDALASVGLLVRYTVAGEAYGYIPLHARYTTVHPKETASVLPEPSRDSGVHPVVPGEPSFPGLREASRDSGNSLSAQLSSVPTDLDLSDLPDPDLPDQVGSTPRATTGATSFHRQRKTQLVARTASLPSEQPTPEYLDAALMAGVPPEQARSTWEHYWGAGLPDRGVEKLTPWLVKRAKERQAQLARSPPRSNSDALEYAFQLAKGEAS